MSKKLRGVDGRGWEGLNLGSIPNDHMPSQKDPKISIEGGVVQFCPFERLLRDY